MNKSTDKKEDISNSWGDTRAMSINEIIHLKRFQQCLGTS